MKAGLTGFFIVFEIKDIHSLAQGIYDPIFFHTRRTVFKKFDSIIHALCAGGDNFDDPIRSPVASSVIQLVFIAYNGNVRFYIVLVICIQEYGKRGRINLTQTAVCINVLSYYFCELAHKLLMDSQWWSHHIHLSINQLSSLPIGQDIDIIYCVSFFLRYCHECFPSLFSDFSVHFAYRYYRMCGIGLQYTFH